MIIFSVILSVGVVHLYRQNSLSTQAQHYNLPFICMIGLGSQLFAVFGAFCVKASTYGGQRGDTLGQKWCGDTGVGGGAVMLILSGTMFIGSFCLAEYNLLSLDAPVHSASSAGGKGKPSESGEHVGAKKLKKVSKLVYFISRRVMLLVAAVLPVVLVVLGAHCIDRKGQLDAFEVCGAGGYGGGVTMTFFGVMLVVCLCAAYQFAYSACDGVEWSSGIVTNSLHAHQSKCDA